MAFGVEKVIQHFGYRKLPPGVTPEQFEGALFDELRLRPVADVTEAADVYEIAVQAVSLGRHDELPEDEQRAMAAARAFMEDAYDSAAERYNVSRDTKPGKQRTCIEVQDKKGAT